MSASLDIFNRVTLYEVKELDCEGKHVINTYYTKEEPPKGGFIISKKIYAFENYISDTREVCYSIPVSVRDSLTERKRKALAKLTKEEIELLNIKI